MHRFGAALLLCLFAPGLEGQQRPLPDADAFLEQVRKRLYAAEVREDQFMYVETRRERETDEHGRVENEKVQVFESYPGLPGEGRWDRQVIEDGRPVDPAELATQDRERQEHVRKYLQRLAENPAEERSRQAEAREEDRRELNETLDEMRRVFEFRMLGRESLAGHDTIVFSLTPRPDAQPRTREGRIMRKVDARVWISESDHELARLEAEALDTVLIGWGVVARVHKGSRLVYERRKVNGASWLPARAEYRVSARVGLVKVIRRAVLTEYSNHRKFDVRTAESYALPGP